MNDRRTMRGGIDNSWNLLIFFTPDLFTFNNKMCWGWEGGWWWCNILTNQWQLEGWFTIKNYLADFFPKFASCFLTKKSPPLFLLLNWVFFGPKVLFLALLNLFIALSSPFLAKSLYFSPAKPIFLGIMGKIFCSKSGGYSVKHPPNNFWRASWGKCVVYLGIACFSSCLRI